jgi:hypothetical protein
VALRPALALAALLGGCASIDSDDWRFCVSREVYPELFDAMDASEPVIHESESYCAEAALYLAAIVLVGPLAFDLAALPVTATHDVLFD